MAKQLKDILKGVKASKLEKGSLGKDPGVDYEPKAGDEGKFVAKHPVEKHENRAGNKDDVFNASNIKYALDDKKKEPRHGHVKGEDKKVYEAREAEDATCNESAKGVRCPVHGMAECWSAKKINEAEKEDRAGDASKTDKDVDDFVSMSSNLKKRIEGASDPAEKERLQKQHSILMKIPNRIPEEVELDEEGNDEYKADLPNMHKDLKAKKKSTSDMRREYGSSWKRLMHHTNQNYDMATRENAIKMAQQHMKEEFELHEVLTKDQPAAEWIHDFVHSDNPKFEGKSKNKRKEMALAAYYAKQREKKN